MPWKSARITYWVVDLKVFLFWIALAFVAGAGPNLAGAISNWLLLGLWALAALVALVIWIRNERRRGSVSTCTFRTRPTDPFQTRIGRTSTRP